MNTKNDKNTPQNYRESPKDEFKNSLPNLAKLVKPWRRAKMKNRKGRENK